MLFIVLCMMVALGGGLGAYFALRTKRKAPRLPPPQAALMRMIARGILSATGRSGRPASTIAANSRVSAKYGKRRSVKNPAGAVVKKLAPPGPIPEKGEPIEGMPAPRGSRLMSSVPSAVILATDLGPVEVLRFYRHHLGARYGPILKMPNGLQIKDERSPVSFVVVSHSTSGLMISLTRNVMIRTKDTTRAEAAAFGVALFPGARLMTKTPTSLHLKVDRYVGEVVDFYRKRYGGIKGLNVIARPRENRPFLSLMNMGAKVRFSNLTVLDDPERPGKKRTMIIVSRNPQ